MTARHIVVELFLRPLFLYAHLSFLSVSAASRKTVRTGPGSGFIILLPWLDFTPNQNLVYWT